MASLIRHGLLKEGLAVDVAASGEDSLWMVGAVDYDAIVLDVMLPGVDGFETCRQIRAKGVRAPVLMLTARDSVEDRVAGLDSGADDYLVKPFAFAELLARLRALARRGAARAAERARGGRPAPRPGDSPRLAGLRPDPALGQGVRAARDVHAPARRGALAPAPARARVGLRLREPLERRRRLHRPPAQQDRRAVRPALARDGPGSRLPAAPGRRRLEATADPPARLGRVRGRDGRRPRPLRVDPLPAGRIAPLAQRSTGSCGCARTTWRCSSASPGTPLAAEHRSRFVETGETYAQVLDRSGRVVDATAPLGRASVLSAAELRQALAGEIFTNRGSVPGLDEPSRIFATHVDAARAPARARGRNHPRGPRRDAAQPARRAADRRPDRAPAGHARGLRPGRARAAAGRVDAPASGRDLGRAARRAPARAADPRRGRAARRDAQRDARPARGRARCASARSSPMPATSCERRSRCCARSSSSRCGTARASRSCGRRCGDRPRRSTGSRSSPRPCS